ncbi:Nitrogen permease regulator 3, partial [Coemansia sp. RSA 552]
QYWRPIVFSQSTVGGGSTHSVAAHRTSAKQLPVADGAGAPSTTVATARELQPGENNGYPHIEPYHALLLLEDVDSLRRRLLYSDASPTLLAVVEKASPTRSLLVLHTLVDCSFAQLCRFVAHLVYWGIARLICPVNLCSTYVPACTSMPQALVDKFGAQSCGLCTLPQLFAAMHPPRPAAQVLEELVASKYTQAEAAASSDYEEHELDLRRFRPEFRNMLVLLLGEGAIAQLHTWPVVLVPNYVKLNLSEEQFVHMSFLWFRSLYTEHPDLLGAFPRALLNRSELQCWAADEGRDQVGIEIVQQAIREAEGRVVLCRIMRKLALRKVRESWSSRRQGKHGKELQCIEQQIADEEDKVHTFCNRVEKAGIDTWMHTKAQREAVLSQARQERVQARRACGKDIGDAEALGRSSGLLYKWYDLVKKDPDLGEFTREIVSKYVSFVPTDAPPHRTEAERRYLRRLVRGRASEQQQDWFDRHVHLFTGSNHLVKLLEVEQTTVARLEAMLREFDGIIMLPQHL